MKIVIRKVLDKIPIVIDAIIFILWQLSNFIVLLYAFQGILMEAVLETTNHNTYEYLVNSNIQDFMCVSHHVSNIIWVFCCIVWICIQAAHYYKEKRKGSLKKSLLRIVLIVIGIMFIVLRYCCDFYFSFSVVSVVAVFLIASLITKDLINNVLLQKNK